MAWPFLPAAPGPRAIRVFDAVLIPLAAAAVFGMVQRHPQVVNAAKALLGFCGRLRWLRVRCCYGNALRLRLRFGPGRLDQCHHLADFQPQAVHVGRPDDRHVLDAVEELCPVAAGVPPCLCHYP